MLDFIGVGFWGLYLHGGEVAFLLMISGGGFLGYVGSFVFLNRFMRRKSY